MSSTNTYSKKDRKITEDLYHYFVQHDAEDGWGDRDKYGNFQQLIKLENYTKHHLNNASILDVGCGTGDMSGFLRGYDIKEYLGIDIVELSLKLAQLKYPKEKFKKGDFLRLQFDQQYDFIFSSGTLAAVLESDNYVIMEAFLKKMWSLARYGVAYNFLVQRFKGETDDTLFLYNLDTVLSICKKLVPASQTHYELNRAGDNLEFLQAHVYLTR